MIACTAASPSDAVIAVVSVCVIPRMRAANAIMIATSNDLAAERVLMCICNAPCRGSPGHLAIVASVARQNRANCCQRKYDGAGRSNVTVFSGLQLTPARPYVGHQRT